MAPRIACVSSASLNGIPLPAGATVADGDAGCGTCERQPVRAVWAARANAVAATVFVFMTSMRYRGVTTRFRKCATVPGPIHSATVPLADAPDLTSVTISTGC